MTKNDEPSRPRLSIELTPEQHMKLWKLIPWGTKGQLFSAIIDDAIEMLEAHGNIFIAAVLDGKIKLVDYLSDKGRKKNGDD